MIQECKDNPNKLNQWEFDFVYSIAEQITKGKTLTKTQCDKLEQIYEKLD